MNRFSKWAYALWEYNTENHTEKFNHTETLQRAETTLKSFTKDKLYAWCYTLMCGISEYGHVIDNDMSLQIGMGSVVDVHKRVGLVHFFQARLIASR